MVQMVKMMIKFDNKEKRRLLICVAFFIAVYLANTLIEIFCDFGSDHPIYYRTVTYIAAIFWFIYLLKTWKSEMLTFSKRLLVSLPIALGLAIFGRILSMSNSGALHFALYAYCLLLCKAANWKQHFAVIIILFVLIAMFGKFMLTPFHTATGVPSLLSASLVLICYISILMFSGHYLKTLIKNGIVDFRTITVSTVKYTAWISGFVILFFIGSELADRYDVPFPITFGLSCILSVGFLLLGYILKLFPEERHK